jgi:putative nucleotidyltransferase with HDIG domain
MRKKYARPTNEQYRILVVDDDPGIIDTLKVILSHSGYLIDGETNPVKAIDTVRNNKYDMLLLDFIMNPIHGNEVVERIRQFDRELYILLLTGHKDLAPPLETIRELDIQGYCEKSDRFDQLLLLVESGIKSIAQMRLISDFKDGLNNILKALPQIYALNHVEDIPGIILTQLSTISSNENVFLLLDNSDGNFGDGEMNYFIGSGRFDLTKNTLPAEFYKNLMEQIGICRSENATVVYNDQMIFPLTDNNNRSIGVLGLQLIYEYSNEMIVKLLEIFAKQVSSALNNASMHSLVNKTYDTLRKSFVDTIEALRIAVDVKDIYTRGHSDRVSYYAVEIAKNLGLPDNDIETVRIAGIFHDIGKIGVADQILFKCDILTFNEYEEIQKHPKKGAEILSAVAMFKDVAPIVLCHHERIDGNGYPGRLKGDEIPYLAKVISVADAFDAMMSDRHYREKLCLDSAREQLLAGKDKQFDSRIVDAFLVILENYNEIQKELEWTLSERR